MGLSVVFPGLRSVSFGGLFVDVGAEGFFDVVVRSEGSLLVEHVDEFDQLAEKPAEGEGGEEEEEGGYGQACHLWCLLPEKSNKAAILAAMAMTVVSLPVVWPVAVG